MKCLKCKTEKPAEKMTKGKTKWCLECYNSYKRDYNTKKKADPEYVKKQQQKQRDWWEKNREWGNQRQREYREGNANFKLSNALRARVKYALLGCVKADSTFSLLGCSPNEWKAHLEKQFTGQMSWDNYGTHWEVDHITPVSHFDLTNEEEQHKAFHYLNTQPLTCEENKRKGNRWVG